MKRIAIDEKWCRDTGVVCAILLLLAGKGTGTPLFLAVTILGAVLIYPRILWPLGFLWKVITESLSFVVPKLFFGLVFAVVIVPLGLIRRAFGADPLMLKSERYESAFKKRDHTFGAGDLITPF